MSDIVSMLAAPRYLGNERLRTRRPRGRAAVNFFQPLLRNVALRRRI
jgi:hypothetical protein